MPTKISQHRIEVPDLQPDFREDRSRFGALVVEETKLIQKYGFKKLRAKANKGDVPCIYLVGVAYLFGLGVQVDYGLSHSYLKRALNSLPENDVSYAGQIYYFLAIFSLRGEFKVDDGDIEAYAESLLRRGWIAGHARSALALVNLLHLQYRRHYRLPLFKRIFARRYAISRKEMLNTYEIANTLTKSDAPEAFLFAAHHYLYGWGVKQSAVRAMELLEKGKQLNSSECAFWVAQLKESSVGYMSFDVLFAYIEAAELGSHQAQHIAGVALIDGVDYPGYSQNTGLKFILRAAHQGFAPSCSFLSDFYATGAEWFPKDLCAAAVWLKRSIVKGGSRTESEVDALLARLNPEELSRFRKETDQSYKMFDLATHSLAGF